MNLIVFTYNAVNVIESGAELEVVYTDISMVKTTSQ